MKLRIQYYWWGECGHVHSETRIDPILGKDWQQRVKINRDNNDHLRGQQIPIVDWITDETEINYMLIKYPDVFECLL